MSRRTKVFRSPSMCTVGTFRVIASVVERGTPKYDAGESQQTAPADLDAALSGLSDALSKLPDA